MVTLFFVTACSTLVFDGPQIETRFTLDGGVPLDAGLDAGVTDAGLAPLDACAQLSAQRCDYLERCGLVDAAQRQTCLDHFEASWCGPSTWPLHVAIGALRFDARQAAACAASFSTRACADFDSLPVACTSFLEPNAGLGAPCFDGFNDCLDGVCRGAVCPRRCQPKGLSGEVCGVDDDCRSGLFCRLSTTTLGVGQCSPFATENEACDDFTRCAVGLWCTGGTCHVLPAAGAACLMGRCDDASTCSNATLDGGVCVPRRGPDAPCSTSAQCLGDLRCLNGLCRPATLTDAGACYRGQQCPGGLVCVGASPAAAGSCVGALGLGQPCALDEECDADLACVPGDGGRVCGTRRPASGACTSPRDCQVDAVCVQGSCAPLPTTSEPCGLTRACLDAVCAASPLVANEFLCVPLLGPGQTCGLDNECASGRCVQGLCLTACTP